MPRNHNDSFDRSTSFGSSNAGDFPDFGSLDALEAAIGHAEMRYSTREQASIFPRQSTTPWPPTVAAHGTPYCPSPAADTPPSSPAASAASAARFPAGSNVAGHVHLTHGRSDLPGGPQQFSQRAGLRDQPARAGDANQMDPRQQQRQTRALEKIVELLQTLTRTIGTNAAGNNNPFQFGP